MPLTIPQLDDRNFEQLLAEAKARIPVHTPEWTNFASEADPGMTVVELFAFMTENLLYRSNRIPERNRQKFLSLLGIPLRPATAAQGLVTFSNERGPLLAWPLQAGIEVRAGKTPFLTRNSVCILPVTAHVFYKQPQPDLDEATKAQYKLVYETFLEQPSDDLKYYKTMPLEAPEIGKDFPSVDLADGLAGVIDGSLWVALAAPKGANLKTVREAIGEQTLTLGIYPAQQCEGLELQPAVSGNRSTLDPGLVFEVAAPTPDASGGFGIGPSHYKRLILEYAEEVLERPGIVQVQLPPKEQLLVWEHAPGEEGTGDYPPLVEDRDLGARIVTWVRIRLPLENALPTGGGASNGAGTSTGAPQLKARLSWVGINAARVSQALVVTNERLGRGTSAPDQTFKVANTPVIVETQDPAAEQAPGTTGGFILEVQNSNGGWDKWRRTDDLWAAKQTDPVYTLDPESGQVTFGDGLRGKRPPLGMNIRVSYEYGGGPAGQVAIKAINKSAALPGGFSVANLVPTWYGDPGESVVDGERNIPRFLKHRDRLVTSTDFRDLTLRTPGVEVGRVEVLPLFHPEAFNPNAPDQTWPGIVTLLVIPRSDPSQPDAPVPNRLFLDAVCRWLDPRRLLTTEVFVRGPEYVPIYVSVGIAIMPGQLREQVRRNVQTALRDYLSPLKGGPPVESAPSLDPVCVTGEVTAGEACPTPRGIGWMLGSEVRRQDLEAVVTRVPGVRYVEGIQLGMMGAGGATLTDLTSAPIVGLQLPRLAALSVREGAPEDLGILLGQKPVVTLPNLVAVPLLPASC